ncbi:MAG: glycosyltransferase family 39 protein, partial [Gemmiger sp.]|nr:glycosyltransferase family 39 protein [Gemmiger sp.]
PQGHTLYGNRLPTARQQWAVAGAALGWAAAMLGLFCLVARVQAPATPILQTIQNQFCGGLDARHYIDLAQHGYGAGETGFAEQYLMIVFFPLYPWLLRLFVPLGANLWVAGMGLNLCFTAAGVVLLYRCTARAFGEQAARLACVLQLAVPGSFFLVLPQTEALFFFLNFAFLDALQSRRFALAGAWGVLAALCRANGVLLAGYAVLHLVLLLRSGQRPKLRWVLPVAGPAAGLGGYLWLNAAVYGNPFQFTIYQREHWTNGFQLFTDTIQTMYGYIGKLDSPLAWFIGLWTVVLIMAEIALLAAAARRLPPDWLLLGAAGFGLMNGQLWLISAQRYALGMPALAPALAGLCDTRKKRMLAVHLLGGLGFLYFMAFTHHAPIY